MAPSFVAVIGAALGLVASLPTVFLMEQMLAGHGQPRIGRALAGLIASFAVLSASIGVTYVVARDMILPFGITSVVTFLIAVIVDGLRAWQMTGGTH